MLTSLTLPELFENITSKDRSDQTNAYLHLMALTEEEADWAYEVWEGLVQHLTSQDNHLRSIASQLLSSLAISDPEQRILDVLPALIEVTKDKKFVTARHCLQSLWRIGLAGEAQKEALLAALAERYRTAMDEKNGTLIRFDIIQGLRTLYDKGAEESRGETKDEGIRQLALGLIETEEDLKYRKKYAAVWKK